MLSGYLIVYDSIAKIITRSVTDNRFNVLKHKFFAVYLVEIDHFSRIKSNICGKYLFEASAVFTDNIYIERATRTMANLCDDLPNTRTTIKPYAPDFVRCRIIIDSTIDSNKYNSFAKERSYSHCADIGYCIFSLNFRIIS